MKNGSCFGVQMIFEHATKMDPPTSLFYGAMKM